MCGSSTIALRSWLSLASGLLQIIDASADASLVSYFNDLARITQALDLWEAASLGSTDYTLLRQRVAATLFVCCYATSTDDRDHVYGLLGLLPSSMYIEPNYTLPTAAVYEEAANPWVRALDTVGLVLTLCPPEPTHLKLPSWVPSFSSTRYP